MKKQYIKRQSVMTYKHGNYYNRIGQKIHNPSAYMQAVMRNRLK